MLNFTFATVSRLITSIKWKRESNDTELIYCAQYYCISIQYYIYMILDILDTCKYEIASAF